MAHLIRAGPFYTKNKRIRGSYNLIQLDIRFNEGRIIFRKPHKGNPKLYAYDNEASILEGDLDKNGIFTFQLEKS